MGSLRTYPHAGTASFVSTHISVLVLFPGEIDCLSAESVHCRVCRDKNHVLCAIHPSCLGESAIADAYDCNLEFVRVRLC